MPPICQVLKSIIWIVWKNGDDAYLKDQTGSTGLLNKSFLRSTSLERAIRCARMDELLTTNLGLDGRRRSTAIWSSPLKLTPNSLNMSKTHPTHHNPKQNGTALKREY